MQLGNCFLDGDGNLRFSSYQTDPTVGDERITGLTVGEESFTIKRVTENYRGYEVESVTLLKRSLTEWRGDLMYYTNYPSDLPETLEPIRSRAVGKTFFEGTIEQKGVGEIELGEFVGYSGKLGEKQFFVFGIMFEWSDASFDETIYSFAPDYDGVDYEWLNDHDIIADEDKADEPVEDDTPIENDPGGGVTIDQAVVIQEKDAQYLLHNFTEIEYNSGSQIGYAGPGNQIILQEQIAYRKTSAAPNGVGLTTDISADTQDSLPDITRYLSLEVGGAYINNVGYLSKIWQRPSSFGEDYATYQVVGLKEDNTEYLLLSGTSVDNNWSGAMLSLIYSNITPPGFAAPGTNFYPEFGCVSANLAVTYRYRTYRYSYRRSPYMYIPFKSLAEYQAAVGLTYEPLTRTRVEDNPTVVSESEVN